jgi:thermitase
MSHLRVPALLVASAVASLALASNASAAYDDDTMVVKFKSSATTAQKRTALAVPGVGKSLGTVGGVGANVVSISRDAARLSTTVSRLPGVAYAEPNYILRTTATPNDPMFVDEYGLHNTGQTGGRADADIDAPEGWDAAGLGAFPNSGGTRVGIVDTGIDRSHPDLAGKTAACATSYSSGTFMLGGQCADDNGHGSHVAGTIAANTNNGQGVAGVAPNSALVICKALATAAGTGLTTDIANCINWTANQNVKLISMSLGGGDNATLKTAVQNATNRGVLLIAAAGNDGDATLNYPAAYPEVMSVAATTDRDERASFSNANADVEIAAPGDAVVSTYTGGLYMSLSGTSMATPHVAGVASVVFWRNPGASAASVRSTLTSTADDLGSAGRDATFGFGRVNLCRAAGGACTYTPGA